MRDLDLGKSVRPIFRVAAGVISLLFLGLSSYWIYDELTGPYGGGLSAIPRIVYVWILVGFACFVIAARGTIGKR